MYNYTFKFLATTETGSFSISSKIREILEEFERELLLLFARIDEVNEEIIVESLQQNTLLLRQKIEGLVNRYKSNLPQLSSLPSYFRRLKEHEYFFFIPANFEFEPIDTLKLYSYLESKSEGKSFDDVYGQVKDFFEDLFQKYHMLAFGDKRVAIGEPLKEKRVCRFCQNKRSVVTFKNKSHAISEALGNKTLILYDECDACNAEFSQSIEPDVIQYLAFFRTVHGVKGKGGGKKLKGKNFDLKREEDVLLTFSSDEQRPKKFSMPYAVKLEPHGSVNLQNIYKCLCKYFLSVVEAQFLPHFSKTIDWVNGKILIEKLPKIGELISYQTFSIQPKIVIYIRKNEDRNIPYAVGEFHFTCKHFVFIIPLNDQDKKDFTDESDFENYWRAFSHLNKFKSWVFSDFSNNEKKDLIFNLNFELRDKSSDATLGKN